MTELTPEDAAAQRASEQARLRKERREAKIKAGGASRLDKITGLGGRAPDSSATSSPAPSATASPAPTKQAAAPPPPPPASSSAADHADPDEVDISQHYYEPTPPTDFQNAFAAMGAAGDEDPMMKMLSQMMAGGGLPGGADGSPFPPGFPGFPGMPGAAGQQAQASSSSADYLWRVLHAVFALTLGLYIVATTHFTGAKAQRERTALALTYPTASDDVVGEVNRMEEGREVFFWMFATAEALLITTRMFLLKGRPAEAGIVWTVAAFLPGPWRGWVETALRYGNVFASVRRDILVCVFVLGVVAWVKG
ncbi:BTB/POZ domain-containing protein 1 [Verticillium dahliae VDG2]|nr:BTB/POZ domain-containing protein 1 [Verticillium dahliae VDG2]